MPSFGLIGYPLSHSFSKKYFEEKFLRENYKDYHYDLFPLNNIHLIHDLLQKHRDLLGLNVTIPYKLSVFPLMDELDDTSRESGAVNTIRIERKKNKIKLYGYNTDIDGFDSALTGFIGEKKLQALILGTGGASKAIAYVLRRREIPYLFVSRKPSEIDKITYNQLNREYLNDYKLIINTTPLGTYPNIKDFPEIPYHLLSDHHFLFDLVYNPAETMFLKKGKDMGCSITNGLQMLYIQADKSFSIWENI